MTLHSPCFSHLCKSTLCWDCTEEKTLALKCEECVSAGQTLDLCCPGMARALWQRRCSHQCRYETLRKQFLLQALEQMRFLRLEPLDKYHWIFSQSFFTLGKISCFLCWWVAVSFSHSNLQVKSFPFPWWVSRQGVCPSGNEDAGYLSALGAWKSRSCLKHSREENSFHHLQKCHTLLKRFARCSD